MKEKTQQNEYKGNSDESIFHQKVSALVKRHGLVSNHGGLNHVVVHIEVGQIGVYYICGLKDIL